MENDVKSASNGRLFRFGAFRLDANERLLFRDGELVEMPAKAFDLLLLLVEAAGHLKSREELIEALWPNTIVVENSLSWHIGVLRKILGEKVGGESCIETVRGHGYRFVAQVEVEFRDEAEGSRAGRAPTNDVDREGRPETDAPDGKMEDVGASLLASTDSAGARIASKLAPTGEGTDARRRRALFALAGAVIVVIAGVLIWRFAPLGQAGAAPTPVIAVLPFENVSADPKNAYFADGIQDTILSKLAGVGGLRVISRTSTKRYPSHPINLKKVAAELGASAIMEGSVQKSGNRVLINVQLINAKTNEHIWAHVYTRSLADVFAVESDVAEQVAAALKAKLLPAERARVAKPPTRNPKAYDLFLQANYLARQITGAYNARDPVAVTNKAVSLYRQAIALDPRFALAYAWLSYLESRVYWRAIDHTPQRIAAAEADARKALALAPNLGEAHLAAGYAAYYGERDYAAALKQFRLAEQSMPNNVEALVAISLIQRRQGNLSQALAKQRKAARLDPRNPHLAFDMGCTLALTRHYPQAIRLFDRALTIEPYNFLALTHKVWTQLLAGQTGKAAQTIASIPPTSGPFGQMSSVRFRLAWLNRQPRAALKNLADAPDRIQAPNFTGQTPTDLWRAEALQAMGKKEESRAAFEKARAALKKVLHTQPENPDFLSALGLVEAGLGNKTEAIRNGLRATRALPIGKDAIAGTLYVATLAKIYAHFGDAAQAVKLLGKLLAMPAGLTLSVPLLKLDPVWDPIRNDPAFQALLKQYAPKEPRAKPKAKAPATSIAAPATSLQ